MNYKLLRIGKPAIILAAVAALGWMVMVLWNAVMPTVFAGVHPVDYLHSIGLLALSRILFGGFGGTRGWRQRRRWRQWEAMTPAEREHFKTSFSKRYRPREAE